MEPNKLEDEIDKVKSRVTNLEVRAKVADVEVKNQLNRIEGKASRVEKDVDEIKEDNKKLLWVFVVAFVGAVAAFVLRGGLGIVP